MGLGPQGPFRILCVQKNLAHSLAVAFGDGELVHQIPSGWLLRMGCCYEWTNQLFSATSRHGIFGRMAVPDGYYEWVAIPNGRINYFRPPVATPHYARGAITNGNTKFKRVKIKRDSEIKTLKHGL